MIMTSRLPKEYTEVEYIQNSGTQYIDTGFILNYDKSIKIEIETTPTATGHRYCLLSNYNAGKHLSLEINASDKGRAYWNNGQVDKTLGTMSISDKNTIIFEYDATNKQYNFIVNDETANGNMNATGVSGSSLLIFVDQAKRFSTFSTPIQIYSVRIWEDNILIKDLIPCVRKSDDEVGMYDLANGIFLTNAGTGTFTAGNKVQVKVKKIKTKINETMKNIYYITTKVNNVMVKVFSALSVKGTGENITLDGTANLKFIQPPLPSGNSNQDTAILPTGYTQLDYIESTGTQYINTDLALFNTSDHEIVIDFEPTQFYNYNSIWGSTYDADTFESWIYGTGALAMRYNYVRYGTDNALSVNSRHLIKVKKENTTLSKMVDDTSLGTGTASTKTTDAKFLLFLSGSAYGKYKLYSCKLYQENILVRDLVPCIRTSDNKIGLYDLVNKVFYTNQGTGEFVAGDVSTETLPNPDFEVPIQNVTGDVKVLVQNKNKLKLDIATDTKGLTVTKNEDGTITLNGTTSYGGVIYISEEFTTIANQDYTISSHVKSGTTTDNPHTTFWNSVASAWFFDVSVGTSQTKQYSSPVTQKFAIYVNANKTYTNYTIDIQLEEGTTASTYTPHQEQTFTFPLGTQRMYLGDYLADDGIHHVRGIVEYDGSSDENWSYSGSLALFYINSIVDTAKLNGDYLCNYFNKVSPTATLQNGQTKYSSISNPVLQFKNTDYTTVADFKTWLSTHNVTVEYELATEEITPYTTEQQTAYDEIKQALSYEEQTNISGSSDESNPLLNVEAYQSIKLVLAG